MTASTYIGFGGDGLPDTEWLDVHARSSRENGDILRAEALELMSAAFTEHTELSPDGSKVRAGSYRTFEFVVALKWAEAFRTCARSATLPDPRNPSHSEVFREETSSCMGNFLAVIKYAEELKPLGALAKWTETVAHPAPSDLERFVQGYMSVFDGVSEVPAFDKALRDHSRALSTLTRSSENFEFDAGVAHATSVLCTVAMR